MHRIIATLCLVSIFSKGEAAVCFGPCDHGAYQSTVSSTMLVVECPRFYVARQANTGCQTSMKAEWVLGNPAVNQFEGLDTAYTGLGRAEAELACERVCAGTNSCEAFAVSSDAHVAEQKWQCTVYYACPSKQYNEHLDLFERMEPKTCFAKATSHAGVFVNYLETNGIVSQTTRTLNVPLQKFFDVHLTVNGQTNETTLGYRPYRSPRDLPCQQLDSRCLFLEAGGYSALLFALFLFIVGFNSCTLWVSLTKGGATDAAKRPDRPLRKPSANRRRKLVRSSEMYF